MMREIFYEYSASAVPPDPTVNSPKYVAPLPYATGYYKAIALEGGDLSTVTSKSFGVSPTDYIHYYPLTADFNDYAGSNNLINYNGTVSSSGCLIDSSIDQMVFTNTINGNISVSMYYTPSPASTWRGLLSAASGYGQLFFNVDLVGYYANGFVGCNPQFSIMNGVEYHIVMTHIDSQIKIYINKELKLDINAGWSNNGITKLGGNSNSQPALGLIKEVKFFNRALTQDEVNSL
jgi:hypothetical protein